MQILIIEDEYHAVKYLSNLMMKVIPDVQILETIDSIAETVDWLKTHPTPDLIFMDIQLADGLSFSIFNKIKVKSPVIFTTAFDQYTLQAFKINSIDYLLKPIDAVELKSAIDKYHEIYDKKFGFDSESLRQIMENFQSKKAFRQRFLIKKGKDFIYLPVQNVAYLYSENGLTFLMEKNKKRHLLDITLDVLEKELDGNDFYRINRKQIIHIQSVCKIFSYFNSRLKLQLIPENKEEVIVSRERVKEFKGWLDR